MATTARFGRLPRQAPSLTATIVALAQEYQRVRENNIEDAWKNGGRFEGKKVTDKDYLDFLKKKRDELDPNDPMWNYYDNQVRSTQFSIEESKMSQGYAEERISEGQMAAFYRSWAKKMPPDSENYRQLMTQAAKFRQAAGARARGGAARARADAYAKSWNDIYSKNEAGWDAFSSLVVQMAITRNILDPGDLGAAGSEKKHPLTQLTQAAGENDPAGLTAILSDLQSDPNINAWATAYIKRYDPHFDGTFDAASIERLATRRTGGAAQRVGLANREGRKGDANSARKDLTETSLVGALIAVTTGSPGDEAFVAAHDRIRALYDNALNDPSMTPQEKQQAAREYERWLLTDGTTILRKSFSPDELGIATKVDAKGNVVPTNPDAFNPYAAGIWGRLTGTVEALNGNAVGATLGDDILALGTSESGPSSDAVKLSTQALALSADNLALVNGTSQLVRTDADGEPDPAGTMWSVIPRGDKRLADVTLIPVPIPAPPGGTEVRTDQGSVYAGQDGSYIAYIAARPIKVEAYGSMDPQTQTGLDKLEMTGDPEIGMVVDIPVAQGVSTPIWGIWTNGQLNWTSTDPFAGQAVQRGVKDGAYVVSAAGSTTPNADGSFDTTPTGGKFDPQSVIAPTFKQTGGAVTMTGPDGKDVAAPSADSPWRAYMMSSDPAMDRVLSMGQNGFAQAERDWFSDRSHWTAEMKQRGTQFAQAMGLGLDDPQVTQQVVQIKVNESQNIFTVTKSTGIRPESRADYDAMMGMIATASVGDRESRLRENQMVTARAAQAATAARLGTQVNQWAQANKIAATGYAGPPVGNLTEAGKKRFGGMAAAAAQTSSPLKLPAGWSVDQLLSQPGLSEAQANDLVHRITGGALGTSLGPTRPGFFVPRGPQAAPVINPFMPKPGVTPTVTQNKYNAAPKPVAPKPVTPKPVYAPPPTIIQTQKQIQQAQLLAPGTSGLEGPGHGK